MAVKANTARPLKIGLVLDDTLDSTDGVQQYVLSLGAYLSGQGHDVHYLVGETQRTDLKNVHSLAKNVRVRFNGNRLSVPRPASRGRLKQLLAAEQFDVLHVQMPYSPLLAGRLIGAAPAKTVIVGTFHIAPYSGLASRGSRLLAAWSRASLRRFKGVVSVSPAAQAFARQAYGLQSTVVPNMFDYERFHKARPLPELRLKNTLNIVFLGRLVPRKGARQLIEAAALLKKQADLPAWRLLIGGGGPQRPGLEALADSRGLSRQIKFMSRIEEAAKPAFLASADIAVFPSSAGESFGIILLEAMASGRAVVLGGDNPGYRSVLGKRPGLLVDSISPAKLAKSLAKYLQDAAARQAASAWGQQTAASYDQAQVGSKIERLYWDLLSK